MTYNIAKRHLRIGFFPCVLILAIFFVDGCSGRTSKTLSRSVALGILKEREAELLSSVTMTLMPFRGLFIRYAIANEDELAGRVPLALALPNLDYLNQRRIEPWAWVLGHFYNRLVNEKFILRQESLENVPFKYDSDPGLRIGYQVLPTEDVALVDGRQIRVTILTPSFGKVTGVQQQETSAQVDAEIEFHETKTYTRLRELAQDTVKKFGLDLATYIQECPNHSLPLTSSNAICEVLQPNETRGPRTRQYRMKLFDDGWRLEK